MSANKPSRRDFLKTGCAAAGMAVPYFAWSGPAFAGAAAGDRPKIGCIGLGGLGTDDAREHAALARS